MWSDIFESGHRILHHKMDDMCKIGLHREERNGVINLQLFSFS